MPTQKRSAGLTPGLAIFAVAALMAGTGAAAQEEGVLHDFNNDGKDGYAPEAGLISDAAGNLYGTTYYGGTGKCSAGIFAGCGIVFELTPRRHQLFGRSVPADARSRWDLDRDSSV